MTSMDNITNSFYPALACEINSQPISIFQTDDGKWHWKSAGLTWDDLSFMSSRGHPGFAEAHQAQQAAIERIGNELRYGITEGLWNTTKKDQT